MPYELTLMALKARAPIFGIASDALPRAHPGFMFQSHPLSLMGFDPGNRPSVELVGNQVIHGDLGLIRAPIY